MSINYDVGPEQTQLSPDLEGSTHGHTILQVHALQVGPMSTQNMLNLEGPISKTWSGTPNESYNT